MENTTMISPDAVSASLAQCYVIIDGSRYNFMQAINLEASVDKNKTQLPILGSVITSYSIHYTKLYETTIA